jgi:CheY-like chemotaxis protein
MDGHEIIELRLGLELDRPLFASLMNISWDTLCAWEEGRLTPEGSELEKLHELRKMLPDSKPTERQKKKPTGHVLIMEDDALFRQALTRLLAASGYQPTSYADAAPALAEVDFDKVDVIITDLRMQTSGEEAIQRLRTRGVDVPVLVLSGYLQPGDAERLVAGGVQQVLAKPFDAQRILAAVEDLSPVL